jgi:hypothetical protein
MAIRADDLVSKDWHIVEVCAGRLLEAGTLEFGEIHDLILAQGSA